MMLYQMMDCTRDVMVESSKGDFKQGLIDGITRAGECNYSTISSKKAMAK
jgi:hypothetical protein